MRFAPIVFFCSLASTLLGGTALSATVSEDRSRAPKIFVLHSYHQEYPWTRDEHIGFVQTLTKTYSLDGSLVTSEHLDSKRIALTDEYTDFFRSYLRTKYRGYQPDLVFCTDDDALRFMHRYKSEIFPTAPVVFCGVNSATLMDSVDRRQYCGVREAKEILPNIRLVQQAKPDLSEILLVGDASSTYQAIRKATETQVRRVFPDLRFEFLASQRLSRLRAQLAARRRGVVLLTTIGGFQDEAGAVVPLERAIATIVGAGDFVVVSMEDVYLSGGVVGGYVTSGVSQGRAAATLAARILRGELPHSIPLVRQSPNAYMFDYRHLPKLALSLDRLPAGSVVLNRPSSFYRRYMLQIWLVIAFCVLQSVVIMLMARAISLRRRAERALRRSQEELELRVDARTAELAQSNAKLSQEVVERRQIEGALRRERDNAQRYLDVAATMFLVIRSDETVGLVNKRGCELLERDEAEIVGVNWFDIFLPTTIRETVRTVFKQIVKHGAAREPDSLEYYDNVVLTKSGRERVIKWHNTLLKDEQGKVEGVLSAGEDVTEQKLLAAQLRQAQKMEAIGTLAGGIAHDFNNILASLMGYAVLARDQLDDTAEHRQVRSDLGVVLTAAERAKELVKQILTFSRHKERQFAPTKLSGIVKEALKLLRASVPSTVDIHEQIEVASGAVHADPGQIHQVVVNLCANASQAMEEHGGVLRVEVSPIEVHDHDQASLLGLSPGPYVRLCISDTGCGMDRETVERIFEPYFTTKELSAERGSGLGLAVVHGIVEAHGGRVAVESEPGAGTTVSVYLPAAATVEQEGTNTTTDRDGEPTGGSERILFVDDERAIVKMAQRGLSRLGYDVTGLTSSSAALQAFEASPHSFDLVITDQTMPQMAGLELSRRLLAIRPDIPIVLCTGHSSLVSDATAKEAGIGQFVLKPVAPEVLARIARGLLHRSRSPGPHPC